MTKIRELNIMNFSIADNIQNVRKRIEKAEDKSEFSERVQLLAVSKTRTADELHQAMLSGIGHFGENYLSEAVEKQAALEVLCQQDGGQEAFRILTWHFIGPIQSNKTRLTAENFDWVHSVDRLKIAQRLNDQRPSELNPLNICIQVNIDEEESKSGVLINEVESLALAVAAMPNLALRGLMCIPEGEGCEHSLRESFQKMKTQFDSMKIIHLQMDTLSMGMSGDMEVAIDCGSSMVRVGTALFGKRA